MIAVSIIVPVFNGLPYLRETVSSLMSQEFASFEVIFLDDGSTDGSLEFLRSISDPRVRVIHQENRGLCSSLNRLLYEAKGEVIARSDQDDVSVPDRIARQYDALNSGDWDFLFCMIRKIGDKRSWSNRDQETETCTSVPVKSLRDGAKPHSTLIARAGAYRSLGYRAEFYPCDDWDLQLRAEERYKVGLLQERLVSYRYHPKSATHGRFRQMQDRSRWAEACSIARRGGNREPSRTEFLTTLDMQPAWRRYNRTRKDVHRWAQRIGGEAWLNGYACRGAAFMVVAACLAPVKFFRRVARAFRK